MKRETSKRRTIQGRIRHKNEEENEKRLQTQVNDNNSTYIKITKTSFF